MAGPLQALAKKKPPVLYPTGQQQLAAAGAAAPQAQVNKSGTGVGAQAAPPPVPSPLAQPAAQPAAAQQAPRALPQAAAAQQAIAAARPQQAPIRAPLAAVPQMSALGQAPVQQPVPQAQLTAVGGGGGQPPQGQSRGFNLGGAVSDTWNKLTHMGSSDATQNSSGTAGEVKDPTGIVDETKKAIETGKDAVTGAAEDAFGGLAGGGMDFIQQLLKMLFGFDMSGGCGGSHDQNNDQNNGGGGTGGGGLPHISGTWGAGGLSPTFGSTPNNPEHGSGYGGEPYQGNGFGLNFASGGDPGTTVAQPGRLQGPLGSIGLATKVGENHTPTSHGPASYRTAGVSGWGGGGSGGGADGSGSGGGTDLTNSAGYRFQPGSGNNNNSFANNWKDPNPHQGAGAGLADALSVPADWMSSEDIKRLKDYVGSYNDLNKGALDTLGASAGDFENAGQTGLYSQDQARQMGQRAIDRQQQQSLMDIASRRSRGAQTGTGGETGVYNAGIRANQDLENNLQSQFYTQENQRLQNLAGIRGQLANTMTHGSDADMQNLMDAFTSNKELFGAVMSMLPQLVDGIIPG